MSAEIERGVPVPNRWQSGELDRLRNLFAIMEAGDSFVWPSNHTPYRAAEQLRIKIKTRKLNGEGYRVWRIT